MKTIHYNGSEETVELILRTVISVNQLSVYGADTDLCNELDPDYAESVICESLAITTESANASATSQSSTSSAQGNLFFRLFREIRRTSWRSEIVETLQRCWFLRQKTEKG